MSSKSKSQLRTENSNNFPNNNSQFITPEKLRGFNNDIIDSLVVSNDTGSYVTTSSFDNGTRDLTFTKADGSTYTNRIPGGGSADTGSLLTTASVADATITFTKGDASQFSIEVDNVTSSLETQDVFVNVKNTSGVLLAKGTPVHAVGVTGENVDVVVALSGTSANMPAIGLLNEELANNAVGQAIISGRIKNIDTSGLVAGASVYVGNSILGELTSTKPTGSLLIQNIGIAGKINATEGELIVMGAGRSNDLPNITEGYIWVGDGNGVPEEFSTGSIAFINKNNTFTGTQNFNNISVSGTGSFGYIESVTGSAKIIGDAFLILNNDTPTERYAGIKVIDSGSSQATASLQFDGQTNDWFYEYTASGDPTNHGVVLFGPEYGTKGSPQYLQSNRVPVGDGGHHLNDSEIETTGTPGSNLTLSFPPQANSTSGNTFFNLNVDSDAGDVFSHISIQDRGTGKNDVQLELNSYTGLDGSNPVFRLRAGGSSAGGQNNTVLATLSDGSAQFYKNSTWVSGTDLTISGSFTTSGNAFTTFNGQVNMNNIFTQSAESLFDNNITQTNGNFSSTGTISSDGNHSVNSTFPIFQANGDSSGGSIYAGFQATDANTNANSSFAINSFTGLDGSNPVMELKGPADTRILWSSNNFPYLNAAQKIVAQQGMDIQGAVSSSSFISASAFVGDGSQLTGIDAGIFKATGSFQATTNDLQVTGSLGVSKAIGGKNSDLTISANTASIDLTQSNTFTVTLVSSADTHLDVSTFGEDAQSVNILVKQPAAGNTGSISFSPDFKFGQGYSYSPTPANSAEDILSFTRFSNSLYGTYINNFS